MSESTFDHTWCVGVLRRIVSDLTVYADGRIMFGNALDSYILCIEGVRREFVIADTLYGLNNDEQAAFSLLEYAYEILIHMFDYPISEDELHNCPVVLGTNGRPRFDIPFEQLECLLTNHFTVPQIADLLNVSQRTIFRRMTEYGLSVSSQYANLTDDELDGLVINVQQEFPMCGNQQMQGHLLSQGFRVQQSRIRESQRRTCPEGTMMRRLRCLERREYRVAGPRSLYHIDGNHKLIR